MAATMILRALCVALACCPAAIAEVWQADQDSGTLNFSAMQAGADFTGGFERFQVKLDFDPAKPASGRLDVTVATSSIDTQDAERDEILRSRDFFWTDEHPQAVFRAEHFQRDGAGWRAEGELAIRGVTKPAAVRFTLAPATGAALMKGTSSLRRLDFGLGQGDFASTEWVGDEVDVQFELKLRPTIR
ncbi:MAG: YceI family protein [Steroidobacteraceae bacterium]